MSTCLYCGKYVHSGRFGAFPRNICMDCEDALKEQRFYRIQEEENEKKIRRVVREELKKNK